MSLIKCKECGVEVSSKAPTCPKCGAPVAKKPMGCGRLIVVIFLLLVIISIFSSIFSSKSTTPPLPSSIYVKPTQSNTQTKLAGQPVPAPKIEGSQWSYSQSNDEMSKGSTNSAQVESLNTVEFEFPYSGIQHAYLALRSHPRFGKDIIFKIEKGQILCPSYSGCSVLVRFDDGAAVTYSAQPPADNSTETIFIGNYSKFVGNMLKAKMVRISANIYQQGNPVFEFDVSGFQQEKYAPKK